jgi:CrcB protein
MNLLAIAIGAILGAWLRWGFGLLFNPLFPTLPLGTLFVNVLGGFLMGGIVGLSKTFFPPVLQLAIVTGFLGSFTTFSTFSAETIHLFVNESYLWGSIAIFAHVGGALLATVLGMYTVRLLT